MLVEAFDELLGLLQAPLAHPQVGEPRERLRTARRVAALEHARGGGQRRLRLRPASGRRQDAAVVRAAERSERRVPTLLHDLVGRPQPLLDARHVVRVLAGGEHATENSLDHVDVVHLAGADAGERLVRAAHSLLDLSHPHQVIADPAERLELEVRLAQASRELDGGTQAPESPPSRPRSATAALRSTGRGWGLSHPGVPSRNADRHRSSVS